MNSSLWFIIYEAPAVFYELINCAECAGLSTTESTSFSINVLYDFINVS